MKLIDVTQKFKTDEDCLDYIEAMRWPNGEIGCVHCGELGRISKITRETRGKNKAHPPVPVPSVRKAIQRH